MTLYAKYKIRTLSRGLKNTELKIEELMNTATNGCVARNKLEASLIKEYTNYSCYAREYIRTQLSQLKDQGYVERRLVFAGWKQIISLLDTVYMRVGLKK